MYSIVLMMALSSGAEAPADVNHGHAAYRNGSGCHCYCSGCHCYGCHSYGCHCYGCHSYGCHSYGCHCYGCHSYCYGSACSGCYSYSCSCACNGYSGGMGGGPGQPAPAKGEQVGPPKKASIAAPATVVVSL